MLKNILFTLLCCSFCSWSMADEGVKHKHSINEFHDALTALIEQQQQQKNNPWQEELVATGCSKEQLNAALGYNYQNSDLEKQKAKCRLLDLNY